MRQGDYRARSSRTAPNALQALPRCPSGPLVRAICGPNRASRRRWRLRRHLRPAGRDPMREADPFTTAREAHARAALVYHRISGRSDQLQKRLAATGTHRMRVGPGIVRLHSGWRLSRSKPAGGGIRGQVTEFSDDSRRRMDTRFAESDWPQHRLLAFITLT